MPKFDEMFRAQAGVCDEFDCDGDAVFKAFGGGKPCSVCGAVTDWFSLSFEAPFCSSECLSQCWDEYWRDERADGFKSGF